MRQLSALEIKQTQIKVLEEFHSFCLSNNLRYSLCAGTLLGAIRHRGYIPWDDDIDVMMPRKDYEIFVHSYNSYSFQVYHYSRVKSYMLSFAKLCDKHTIVKEDSVYESDYGVDIDIFPLDFFPDSISESQRWSNHLLLLKKIRAFKNVKISSRRSFFKNILVLLTRIVFLCIPMKSLVRRVDILAQKYDDGRASGYLGNMTSGYNMKERNPMAQKLIDVEFEGRLFKAVDNYDIYLTGLFGDYMTLPPESKRKTLHTVTAWQKSL